MYLGTSISNKFILVHLVFELSNLCAKCFVSKIIFYTYKHFIIIIITFIRPNRLVAVSIIVDSLHSASSCLCSAAAAKSTLYYLCRTC